MKPHSKRVEKIGNKESTQKYLNQLEGEVGGIGETIGNMNAKTGENTLETSGEDGKLHSKRVEKMENTLETSGEDGKYTRNECSFKVNSLLTLRIYFPLIKQPQIRELMRVFNFSTRFECKCTSSPLVSSVISDLLHSFRV